jgi:hypothetical protein
MGKRHHEEARARMSEAWHTAAFQRSKRMPSLHRVIGDTERAPRSSAEIITALKFKFGVKRDG